MRVLVRIWAGGGVGAPLGKFGPSSGVFLLAVPGDASFDDHLFYFCLVLLYVYARLFVDALKSPAGKGLTSWLSL